MLFLFVGGGGRRGGTVLVGTRPEAHYANSTSLCVSSQHCFYQALMISGLNSSTTGISALRLKLASYIQRKERQETRRDRHSSPIL